MAFRTLGCRLNQAEESGFAAQFLAAGCRLADRGEPLDILVLHSCAVTRAAERETFRQIRSWRRDPQLARAFIAVTGCVVAKGDLVRLAQIVVGRFNRLTVEPLGHQTFKPSNCQTVKPSGLRHKRALLKVQDGCDFGCAYCIVPLTRGRPCSRPWGETLCAARALLDQDFREIVLTGCNLACYRDGGRGLADLADAVCDLAEPYGARIRLGSVEPGVCDADLLSVLLARRNLCRFLHYPIQSGDTGVLRAMGRRYTAEYIGEFLDGLRTKLPLVGIGADFIAGLPGEDEAAFERSCALAARIPFVHLHVFPFSPRQGTRAPSLPNRPSRTIARERAARLRAVGDASAETYRRLLIGHETQVLVEKRLPDGTVCGWNEGYVPCRFPSEAPLATLAAFTPEQVEDGVLRASVKDA